MNADATKNEITKEEPKEEVKVEGTEAAAEKAKEVKAEVKKDDQKETQLKMEPEVKEPVIPLPEEPGEESKYKPGQVVKLEDLEEELEYTKEEQEVLEKLYNQTISSLSEGEIVKGKILSITDKEVAVDIGFKSEGVIPRDEFRDTEELEVGEEIEIFLDKIEDTDGQLRLSKEKADFSKLWDKIVQIYEDGETIEGKIVRRIKGGMVVDLMGIDAFLPGSQIDVKPIRDFDSLLANSMQFKVVKINHLRKNIVVSRRVIIEDGLSEQREKMLSELEVGQVRKGVVKNITDFGVFIDLGGVDGLLHITDLSWGRVSHPSEIVSLDDEIEVVILDFDKDNKRVSLGLKQLQPHPWENIEEKYPVGTRVKGKVVSITDYGAFIELEKGIEGLIHISEMSWTQHIKHPSKIVSIGEEVEAVVLNFDKDQKKISLGLKQIEPDPWSDILTKYPIDSRHKGIVRNITNFGVFVELEEGIDGLIHISDLSWTKKVRHPSEIVKKGEEIEVVILSVSPEDRRISLGFKQLEENPWDAFERQYNKGVVTQGTVVRSIEKGLIVEIPGGVEGFVPSAHMGGEMGGEAIKKKQSIVGEVLDLKVIEFDKEQKKIVLSQNEFVKDAEDKDVQEYMKKQEDDISADEQEKAVDAKEEEIKAEETPVNATEEPAEEKTEVKEAEKEVPTPETEDKKEDTETDVKPAEESEEKKEDKKKTKKDKEEADVKDDKEKKKEEKPKAEKAKKTKKEEEVEEEKSE